MSVPRPRESARGELVEPRADELVLPPSLKLRRTAVARSAEAGRQARDERLKRRDPMIAALALSLLCPLSAAAQPAQPATQGPMIVERVHSGFLIAPDVKITEVDHRTSALAGGYAGWLTDGTFFIGGGGYFLANEATDRKMAYGGVVVQWLGRTDQRLGFGVKGLVGGGQATLGTTLVARLPDFASVPPGTIDRGDLDRVVRQTVNTRVRYRQDFFVAEPEVDLVVRLTNRLRLTGGIGYRLIGAEGRDDNRLRGTTGSVALQIGGGS